MLGTLVPNFQITGLSPEGRAYGMFGEITVFIEKGVPGDVVDIAMIKAYLGRKDLATAKIISIKKKSPLRIEPFCKHFFDCGGCQWQNIAYETQLKFKQQQVEELFAQLNDPFEILPILPSALQRHFRNRVTFTFSNRRWMSPEELAQSTPDKRPAGGFVLKGNNDRIMNIEECFLTDPLAVTIMKSLREFALSKHFSFYDVRHETGFLRTITIRFGDDGNVMAVVAFGNEEPEKIDSIMDFLRKKFPQITSLYYVIRKWKDALKGDQQHIHVYGKPFINYQMEDLVFRTGPNSFYQTNSAQALEL